MQAVNLERDLIVLGQTGGQLCPIISCLALEYEIWNLVLCKSIVSYFEAAYKDSWRYKTASSDCDMLTTAFYHMIPFPLRADLDNTKWNGQ